MLERPLDGHLLSIAQTHLNTQELLGNTYSSCFAFYHIKIKTNKAATHLQTL